MQHYQLTWKFPFWVFKRYSFANFEYKESFGQSWVKIAEWSIWVENFHIGYLKGVRFKFGLCSCLKESFGQIWIKITDWSI